jgi:predicted nuclease with TOPRIM domain
MSETNEPQETQEVVVKSVEELTAEVAQLTKELDFARSENERVSGWWRNLERQKDKLEEYLDENWDSLDDHATAIAEIFDIDTDVEKEVEVSISGTMTIKAPRGYDWDDLSYTSFEVSIDTHWSNEFSIENYDLDVNETNVQDY